MIVNTIYRWARQNPDKVAIFRNGFAFTYGEFARAIEATRAFLATQNLRPGSTAVIVVFGLTRSWIVSFALRSMGLTTICAQTVQAAAELGIDDVSCIVSLEAGLLPREDTDKGFPGAKVIIVPPAIYDGLDTSKTPDMLDPNIGLGGHIMYSSGTTGKYKKVLVKESQEFHRLRDTAGEYRFGPETVFHNFHFSPWTGVGYGLPSTVWFAGGSVVFDQRQDKLGRFFDVPFTHTMLTVKTLQDLLQTQWLTPPSGNDFLLMVSGGFFPVKLANQALDTLTRNIEIQYGATEIGSPILKSTFRTEDDIYWMIPNPKRGVEIVDPDGNLCAQDEEGEFRIQLDAMDAEDYPGDPEATEKFFRDGYFYPGDMAVRRADGRIRILGRTADVLNILGHKQAVAPLEQAVQQILGVDTVCLFSRQSDDGVEELIVVLEATALPPDNLRTAIAHSFPDFERVLFHAIEKFPRTEAGMQKIKRTELRKLISD